MLGNEVAKLWATVGADLAPLDKGLSQADASLKNAKSKMAGHAHGMTGEFDKVAMAGNMAFGNKLSMAAGMGGGALLGLEVAAVALAGKFAFDMVNSAASFEKQMSAVQAVSGASKTEMAALSAEALKLGPAWGKSASEVGAGMEELVKAGISMRDIMGGAAEGAMTLAAAGGTTLAPAATIAANAIKNFNLQGSDMAHVADLIAGAANATTADVNDIGLAFQQSAAAMGLANQTFDSATVAIAVMADAGIRGSDAGTSLKQMFLSLSPTSKKATEEMEKLGIITAESGNRFYDAQGKTKSYREIAQILSESLVGLTDQQKTASLQVIFGSDAYRAAAVSAKAGAEGVDKLFAAMSKTSAIDQAKTRLDNFSGSMDKLGAEWEAFNVRTGGGGLPGLKGLADGLTDVLHRMNATSDGLARMDRDARLAASGLAGVRVHLKPLASEMWAAHGAIKVTNDELKLMSSHASGALGAMRALSDQLLRQNEIIIDRPAAPYAAEKAGVDALAAAVHGGYALAQDDAEAANDYSQRKFENDRARINKLADEQIAAAKRAASAAESAAERVADQIAAAQKDAGFLIRDMAAYAGEVAIHITEIGEKLGSDINRVIADTADKIQAAQGAAADARTSLQEQEATTIERTRIRSELGEKLSAQDRIFGQQMDDAEYHHREEVNKARALRDYQKALNAATNGEQRDAARRAYEERIEEIRLEHLEFDQEVAWRIAQEDKRIKHAKEMARERAELEKQFHDEDIAARLAAIDTEEQRKIDAANADKDARIAALKAAADADIKETERAAKAKLEAMQQNFWDKVPDAARPGLNGVATLIGETFGAAILSIGAAVNQVMHDAGLSGDGDSSTTTQGNGVTSPLVVISSGPAVTTITPPPGGDDGGVPFRIMDSGGVTTRPTLALLSANGVPEEVRPLGSGRSGPTVQIVVQGNTLLGDDYATARALADLIEPLVTRFQSERLSR